MAVRVELVALCAANQKMPDDGSVALVDGPEPVVFDCPSGEWPFARVAFPSRIVGRRGNA